MKQTGPLDHPKFKKFVRKIPAGTPLFRQGDRGNTMFVILDGIVQLIAERDGQRHIAGLLEAGDFLGERAMIGKGDYIRFWGATADTDITVLELSTQDLEFLKIAAPELMTQVMTRIFEVAAERISHLNFLIRGLRSSDNSLRVAHCILYLAKVLGKAVPQGIEFVLSVESIFYYVDMPKTQIAKEIERLTQLGIIEKLNPPYYLLAAEQPLLDYLRTAAKQAA